MKYSKLIELEKILNSKKRYKAIFLLLLRSNDFITSLEVANILKVSGRTIKSDIKEMKESLESYPLMITSTRSKGYLLKIDSKEVHNNLLEYYKTSQTSTIRSEFEERVNYLLKVLLIEKEVSLEDLEEMLFLSRINREMEEVNRRLSLYSLKLKINSSKNYEIIGDDVNKLLIFLRINKQFISHFLEFDVADYNSHFEINFDDYENLEAIFYNTLLKQEIVFSDLYAKRILYTLIFFKNNKDLDINLNDCLNKLFKEEPYIGFRERNFVNTLNENLKLNAYDLKLTEPKRVFLTLLSIMSIDLFHYKDLEPYNYGSLIKISNDMVDFIISYFKDNLYLDLLKDYTVIKDLSKIMLPISIKVIIGASDDLDVGYYRMDNAIEKTIQYKIVKALKLEFEKKYNYKFSLREIYLITSVVQGYFERVLIPKTELNIGIIAINGRLSTQHLKSNLMNYYKKYINNITTMTLYQTTYQKDKYNYIDFYFTMDFGKNLSIDIEPIYYVKEDIKESDIDEKLEFIFKKKISYQSNLPSIKYEVLNSESVKIIDTLKTKSVFFYSSIKAGLKILIIKSNIIEVKFYKRNDIKAVNYLVIRISKIITDLQIKLIFEFIDLILKYDEDIDKKIDEHTNYESFIN